MALIHTATGALSVPGNPLFPTPPTNVTQGSRLSQAFSVTGNSLYTVQVNYNFITNEFPSQSVDDIFRARITSPGGATTELATESRLSSAFTNVPGSTTLGFVASTPHGETGFKTVTVTDLLLTSGEIRDVGKVLLQVGGTSETVNVTAEVTPVG